MQPSCGMTLIFLLVRLQWNRSNTEAEVKETSKGNSSVTENHHSAVQLTSQRFVLHMTTTLSPSIISHAAPAAASAKEIMKRTEMISGLKSISLRSSDGTTFSSNVSKNGINNSATNFHRSPVSLATFRTTEVTKSAAPTSSSTVTPSHSTVIYATLADSVDNSSIKPTLLLPINVALTSPTVKQDSPTPNFNPIQQTKLNQNSSNLSTASPNPKDANEDKNNKEGVIAGITVGAILGSVLIGLVGYFICAKV